MLFKVPIIGTGTQDDPKRPEVAEYVCKKWQIVEEEGNTMIVEVEVDEDTLAAIEADVEIERV